MMTDTWKKVEMFADAACDFGQALADHLADIDDHALARQMREAEKEDDIAEKAARKAVECLENEIKSLKEENALLRQLFKAYERYLADDCKDLEECDKLYVKIRNSYNSEEVKRAMEEERVMREKLGWE